MLLLKLNVFPYVKVISQQLSTVAGSQYPTVAEERMVKALIVEDELTNRMIMKKILSPYGEFESLN
jgi:hypothetical protein